MAFSVAVTTTNKIENYTTSRDATPSGDLVGLDGRDGGR
jgi:hypothetical protein